MSERTSYQPGIGQTGAYLVAGMPYITGSADLDNGGEHTISFPYVTRSVTVINHSSSTIRVHFAPKASNSDGTIDGKHFIELDSDEDSITMNVKCKEIYISNASGTDNLEYRVFAELTGVATGDMPTLSGAGIDA